MHKRLRTEEKDAVTLAKEIVDLIIGEPLEAPGPDGKNPAAVALGKLGGRKGGLARSRNLTPQQKSESARKAANARWDKKTPD